MKTEYFKHKILPLKNKLFRKALCITESADDAADVVQEVMVRMWEKREEWHLIQNMEVYCMVLAKNIALDMLKKRGRQMESMPDTELHALPSEDALPLKETVREDEKKWLWKLIRSLPEKQQDIVCLREFEEMSYQEIAVEMNLTEPQVKMQLFRARQKIKEMYLKVSNYGL